MLNTKVMSHHTASNFDLPY